MMPIQFLMGWAARSSVLIAAGALLVLLLRVKNPAVRLAAWAALVLGSLAIPVLRISTPKLPAPVLANAGANSAEIKTAPPLTPLPAPAAASREAATTKPFDWPRFAGIVYTGISAGLLLRILLGVIGSLRIVRRSRRTSIAGAQESCDIKSPVTIGNVVLLPLDWRAWSPAKLEAVLAHERSHIRRHDPALQLISAIHCALLWVSPASWLLHRAIGRTAEEISDEDAVSTSNDRASYAGILLEFVQRGAGPKPLGVPMAWYDRPEKRIRRILNSTGTSRAITRGGIAAIVIVGASMSWLSAAAEPQDRAVESLRFEVVSIKPVNPEGPHMVGLHLYPGGRVVIPTTTLKGLIRTAFHLSPWQLAGGDPWMDQDQYNIEAKPPQNAGVKDLRYSWFDVEDARLRQMLQSLLIDRFQFKFHRESRTMDAYLMKRNDKPLKLRPSELPDTAEDGIFACPGYVDGKWSMFLMSMPQLAKFAGDSILRAPVLDRTGLTGLFDYRQPQPDVDPAYGVDQSNSFKHFLDAAGFTLERSRGQVEVLVIDHAAKPSAN